jgi:hypothetical protein
LIPSKVEPSRSFVVPIPSTAVPGKSRDLVPTIAATAGFAIASFPSAMRSDGVDVFRASSPVGSTIFVRVRPLAVSHFLVAARNDPCEPYAQSESASA